MRFKNKLFILFLLTILSGVNKFGFSQGTTQGVLIIDGLVYGYNYDPQKKLLKKEKQIKVEGVLDKVIIDVLENEKVIKTTQTNSKGVFLLKIKTGKIYTLAFSKSGYTSIFLTIDLIAIPKEISNKGITFSGAEFILNSFQSKNIAQTNQPFGKLLYNKEGKHLDFEPTIFKSKRQREYNNNLASLMLRSVEKNINNNNNILSTTGVKSPSKIKTKTDTVPKVLVIEQPQQKNYYDNINKTVEELKQKTGSDLEKISDTEIQILENNIKEARIQFEKDKSTATSAEDSLILKERELILNTVELELNAAKKLIELQKNKISTQGQLLFLAIACVLLLSVLLIIIYRFNKEKKKTYDQLKEKNKKITDSINYASRIQKSILPSDTEIKKQLPQSFIYFQPRDVVSGDFYWISTINEKTIIACIDCTGHGVPGAFMSLIGNTLLNSIVNEKQITNAASILKHLHIEVLKALNQNTERVQSKDGMEMSLCVVDKKTNTLEFAGAMNPLYIVKDNIVTVIKPDTKAIGGVLNLNMEIEFTDHIIPIQKNTSIYMFTDGYMDQFGGPENKKFNVPNFKKLLLDIQSLDMNKQKAAIEQTIQEWQGDTKQIDDMLVIGIRF